ncbi:gasdermin-C-like [Camelus ferus]|uniref:Gasdermin-C-like n=1 Tax=Camelus ferus TaxID=419612 RepID=A0A8B8S1A8_CAMFR|nr:gasdermin-C-like [Camelus ferus]
MGFRTKTVLIQPLALLSRFLDLYPEAPATPQRKDVNGKIRETRHVAAAARASPLANLAVGGFKFCTVYFKCLQEKFSQKVEAVAQLSKDVQDAMFYNIPAILRDGGVLRDLTTTVRASYSCLGLIKLGNRECFGDLAAQTHGGGRTGVRSILEPNFRYPESIAFTLKPELLAPLQGEGVAITFGLLEGCGLMVEPISHTGHLGPGSQEAPVALYGSLSVLQRLAEA